MPIIQAKPNNGSRGFQFSNLAEFEEKSHKINPDDDEEVEFEFTMIEAFSDVEEAVWEEECGDVHMYFERLMDIESGREEFDLEEWLEFKDQSKTPLKRKKPAN